MKFRFATRGLDSLILTNTNHLNDMIAKVYKCRGFPRCMWGNTELLLPKLFPYTTLVINASVNIG